MLISVYDGLPYLDHIQASYNFNVQKNPYQDICVGMFQNSSFDASLCGIHNIILGI